MSKFLAGFVLGFIFRRVWYEIGGDNIWIIGGEDG